MAHSKRIEAFQQNLFEYRYGFEIRPWNDPQVSHNVEESLFFQFFEPTPKNVFHLSVAISSPWSKAALLMKSEKA